ncbi:MAG: UDP-N-acetylglucosamine 2-epimerase [Burkholderiales bacterium]
MRKICVVTGSRAEYGILYWLIRELADDPDIQLQLVATGMHLMPEFGSTFRAIEADGFTIDRKVEMMISSDTPTGMAKSVGLGVLGFADVFDSLAPDAVVVLGDRFEMLAVAQAAFVSGYVVAHISGGEVTEGAIDDAIRHAITKLSRYHFVAAERYRERVIQLGEQPERIFNVGDPGLDNIARLKLLDRAALCHDVGLDPALPFFLVTYHPVTLGATPSERQMQALLDALDERSDHQVLITKPNADAGGRLLSLMVDEYARKNAPRVVASTSLGQLRYLSAMKHCAAVVGNSSSGIVEAPAMARPTVNIGQRQDGRLRATSIVDCSTEPAAILSALDRVASKSFQRTLTGTISLYGQCDASTRIREILKRVELGRHLPKPFHDLAD